MPVLSETERRAVAMAVVEAGKGRKAERGALRA
jgi:hypothetical protein